MKMVRRLTKSTGGPMLTGVTMLASAYRTWNRKRGRSMMKAAIGLGLVGFGIRQRQKRRAGGQGGGSRQQGGQQQRGQQQGGGQQRGGGRQRGTGGTGQYGGQRSGGRSSTGRGRGGETGAGGSEQYGNREE